MKLVKEAIYETVRFRFVVHRFMATVGVTPNLEHFVPAVALIQWRQNRRRSHECERGAERWPNGACMARRFLASRAE